MDYIRDFGSKYVSGPLGCRDVRETGPSAEFFFLCTRIWVESCRFNIAVLLKKGRGNVCTYNFHIAEFCFWLSQFDLFSVTDWRSGKWIVDNEGQSLLHKAHLYTWHWNKHWETIHGSLFLAWCSLYDCRINLNQPLLSIKGLLKLTQIRYFVFKPELQSRGEPIVRCFANETEG